MSTIIRFRERELSPYPEPLKEVDVKQGEVYFTVRFFDDDLHVPILHPLVFVGADVDPEDPGLYFLDYDSYTNAATSDARANDELEYDIIPHGDYVHSIYDYERALDRLLECSLRRRGEIGPAYRLP